MDEAIKRFPKQLEYQPEIANAGDLALVRDGAYVVAGMGGSHLAADLLKCANPQRNLTVHSDYGFPSEIRDERLSHILFIASSYSGNTEETIDALAAARKKNAAVAVVAAGGKLIETAKKDGLPYVQLPDTGIQPRSALGFSAKALLALMKEDEGLRELNALSGTLERNMAAYEKTGRELADKIAGRVPLVYSSLANRAIAYNWKIKLNETGKIPAFYNVFPELNHNEMTGFDVAESTKPLSEHFCFIILKDESDHPQTKKRMEVTEALYKARGLEGETMMLEGKTVWEKIFSSLLTADWTAFHTAKKYGLEAEQVPMVEEFKKRIAG